MIILSIKTGWHDASAVVANDYEILSAVQMERLTRRKTDGRNRLTPVMVKEALRIAGVKPREVDALLTSRMHFWRHHYIQSNIFSALKCRFETLVLGSKRMESLTERYLRTGSTDFRQALNVKSVCKWLGLRTDTQFYDYNHHFAHALSALFFTDWNDALLYTADGGGDTVYYSMHHLFSGGGGGLKTFYGGNFELKLPLPHGSSLGAAYSCMTRALGYISCRHEGKLTGLAAYGQPTIYPQLARHFSVDADGMVRSNFADIHELHVKIFELAKNERREDAACSIQKLLEDIILQSIRIFLQRTGARKIGLAGGVFANVALNRRIAELPCVDEVFIFPGMGDEGIAVGGLYEFLLRRDGLETWLSQRHRLQNVYWGGCYDREVADCFNASGITRVGEDSEEVARLLAAGKIVAIYAGRMEFGPRALGARSILASPSDPDLNDSLNRRLARTEFMPFAPVVLEEDADAVFDVTDVNRYAMRFMTISCNVREHWRKKIPAVVHIDGSARPQIIRDADHPLYAEILRAFKKQTGLPVLINTSFNAHEEPIIRTPKECLRALRDGRVDYVATTDGIYCNARRG